ncbi:MAG: mechanosensitive ion channel domain-containing protein [Myxococcota bacterium]
MATILRDWLLEQNVGLNLANAVAIAFAVLVAYLSAQILRELVRQLVKRLTSDTPIWPERLSSSDVYRTFARTVVVWIARDQILPVLEQWEELQSFVDSALGAAALLGVAFTLNAVVNVVVEVLEDQDQEGRMPIRVMGQAVMVVVWCYVIILLVSVLTGQDVSALLTSLTAVGAVLVYVFRDLVLGWTAVIQIASNDLLRTGDWISMPAYGADGTIEEIAITTIKVRNWDKTTVAVPTYAFVSEGFQNHRSMVDAGARKVTIDLTIDATTLHDVDDTFPTTLAERGIPVETPAPGTAVTNLWWFRTWLREVVTAHALTKGDESLLIRVLDPVDEGTPIQVYAFSSDTDWGSVEGYRAELIERAIAALAAFELRLYQSPTTQELRTLGENLSGTIRAR